MKVEAGLVNRKRQGNCQLPKEMSRSSKKNRRRQKKSITVVQKLFETCRDVFSASGAGIVPSQGDVERIRLVLGMGFFPSWVDFASGFCSHGLI